MKRVSDKSQCNSWDANSAYPLIDCSDISVWDYHELLGCIVCHKYKAKSTEYRKEAAKKQMT